MPKKFQILAIHATDAFSDCPEYVLGKTGELGDGEYLHNYAKIDGYVGGTLVIDGVSTSFYAIKVKEIKI